MVLSQLEETRLDQDVVIISNPDTPTQYTNCKVSICAMGDDRIGLDLSQDGGVTFPTNLVPTTTGGWTIPITHTYGSLLSTDTRFLFTVTDNWYECLSIIS